MGILPLVLLSLVGFAAAGDPNALDVGNSHDGWDLIVTDPPRECAPMRLWYNVSNTAGAVISFRTPEDSRDEWMTLSPPSGTGTLSWTVTLHQGKQFILKNTNGYEQVLTVGSASGGTSCGQDAAQVTGTSNYGALHSATYDRLRSTQYAAFSVSPGQFRQTEFPSGSFQNHAVQLGVAVSTTSQPSKPDQPTTSTNPNNSDTPTDPPSSGGSNSITSSTTSGSDGQGTSAATPAVTPGGATNGAVPSSATQRGSQVTPASNGSTDNSSGSNGSTDDSTSSQPGGSNAGSNGSGSGSNTGAIVGGILAALIVGSLIGAFCVWLHRRRRRRLREAEPVQLNSTVETMMSTTGSTSALYIPSRMDRKNPNLYMESDDDLCTLPGPSGPSRQARHSYFGGQTDYPVSMADQDADTEDTETVITNPAGNVPPPRYSRFA